MSKPVFEDLFAFSGRRNRKSYNLYQVAMALFGGVGELMVASGEVALAVIGGVVLFNGDSPREWARRSNAYPVWQP